jgi:hypothetical protein
MLAISYAELDGGDVGGNPPRLVALSWAAKRGLAVLPTVLCE